MLIQIYFWNFVFQKLINYTTSTHVTTSGSITILVCAKNEYHNLERLVPILLKQKGNPKILVVDDFSEDDTLSLLSAYENDFPNFNFISASKNIVGKKQALIDGLSNIKTNWILLTDADCQPATDQWASSMMAGAGSKQMVLGFSPYGKKDGFLNRWIRYEAGLTAIQYLSYSLMGKTYMGVGRNLLYSKELVNLGENLYANLDLASGDDDLLVNSLSNKDNVSINIDPSSWVISQAKESWKSYFTQKRRHMSTASRYKKSHQFLLLFFSISWIVLYIGIIALLINGKVIFALSLLLMRMLSTYSSNVKLFPKLGLKDSLAHWWYLDSFTAIYFLFFSIFAILPQKETW